MTLHTNPAVAAVDWGTSHFRIWLLDANGTVLAERRSAEGLLSVPPQGFAGILETHLAELQAPPSLPVVICGMAGSRQGWVEAPYASTPVALDAVQAGAVGVASTARKIRIVPGIAQHQPDAPDVMRGEETQLAGIAALASGNHLVCMPGTHSKWVEMRDGTVTGFCTWLTGELFSLLSSQSILRHSVIGAEHVSPDAAPFHKACAEALAQGGDIGAQLFRIRAAGLLAGLSPDDSAATLSGLLIGAEIASATRRFAAGDKMPVTLVGSAALAPLYRAALELAGHEVRIADGDAAVRAGLFAAARHLDMVESKDRATA
ncbi:2-dehydro-3-deoxygalactonokinase [Pseudaminobacter soli (ex Li et al. 2025)]|uniref:2-dehydro-3-deoxygalactonokinase n=1 Tax=Pseudaminobacter soli (ex Li et al. 2025) TaxID=1295366 RepID=A0A2P7SI82_9HYPH|nr:2-dehydro-3-deoxygalactonokinase [Mesorhizobium soli]PSJ62206.1 2-dehydro-3-deoxygalactonokinase [Mesorhizobium soli]